MGCEFICDGCGKRATGEYYARGDNNWHKPGSWYERSDKDGPQTVCSRDCIEKVAQKSGKTAVVAPF